MDTKGVADKRLYSPFVIFQYSALEVILRAEKEKDCKNGHFVSWIKSKGCRNTKREPYARFSFGEVTVIHQPLHH